MRIIADTHTHTVASGHAYSTISENALEAKRKGLEFLCMTDHTQAMVDTPHELYFKASIAIVPQILHDVYIIRGCEANVMDREGHLDMSHNTLSRLEWVIASFHNVVIPPMTKDAVTQGWLALAENPDVDVFGHTGDGDFPFEHETVIKACAKYGKIIEINSHSFDGGRKGSAENCRDIARLCMKYNVPVVVSSDAHFWTRVGDFANSVAMLDEIQFPNELILNADRNRMAEILKEKTGRVFPRLST